MWEAGRPYIFSVSFLVRVEIIDRIAIRRSLEALTELATRLSVSAGKVAP